ncbi:juvenile hormone epoxide hydrolase 1-like [Chelonus insularis]|uniref:juvenile hormone epoxide hydrolase 1-like n=1 Tax=Chelonus insularis TaxID=460826 RepID=UPI00158E4382|nr:juvenile hormone epoxide hydrolase 1-like [Chelonus insularis]
MSKILLLTVVVLYVAYYFGNVYLTEPNLEIPKLPETNWGPANRQTDDSIRPFKINVSEDVIHDLKQRLSRTRYSVPPLENTGWTYGVSSKYLKEIVNYWKDHYNWYERQELLNKYPQFITTIQGIDIHFYHVKPSKLQNEDGRQLKVFPLLLLHGWPGSVVEFQKIIPLLTTPRPGKDFVFEVIAPSLPGFGFSEGAVRPGLGTVQMAVIFKNLMQRLGFDKYYAQGGDWGSLITHDLATLFPDKIFGAHANMCPIRFSKIPWKIFLGAYFPSLYVEPEHASKVYPLKYHWGRLLEESGYFHIQATKPDTIGAALSDSPAALAAYILEKFSTWTNPEFRFVNDGGLLVKFTMDELLDNVMLYWVTNSITTSVRIYAESFSSENFGLLNPYPVTTLFGFANFPNELSYTPESVVRSHFKNLIHFSHLPRGGHFAAFEEPQLLSDDIYTFVDKIQNMDMSTNPK